MFNDIIKSSKALEMLEHNMLDTRRGNKPLSAIEQHLVDAAERFLLEQMRDVGDKLKGKSKRCL